MNPPKPFFKEQGVVSLHVHAPDGKVEISVGVETFVDGTEWTSLDLTTKEAELLSQMLLESVAYTRSEGQKKS